MRLTICLLVTVLGLAGGWAAGAPSAGDETRAEPYADAKAVLEPFAGALETFVARMEEAATAAAVAAAVNALADEMARLIPELNAIRAKYPELADERTHPEELKPLLARIDKDFQNLMKAYHKVGEYREDPAVQAADARYREVMSGLK